MTLASISYVSDGITTDYSFPFVYLQEDDVKVIVDGVEVGFVFLTASSIRLDSAAPLDSVILIKRETDILQRFVDFVNGSIQDASDFNLDSNQLFYLIQEISDGLDGKLSRFNDGSDNRMFTDIDMNGFKIINLGEPVNSDDAARLQDATGGGGPVPEVPDASETVKGILRLATQTETNVGTDDTKAVTPLKLKTVIDALDFSQPDATELVKGIIQIATQLETDTGTDDTKAITPLKLKAVIDGLDFTPPDASETTKGIIEIATQPEVDAGTDDERAVTPLKLETRISAIPLAPAGSVIESFGAPSGYLEMNGSEQPKASYGDLVTVLGSDARKISTAPVSTGITGILSLGTTSAGFFKGNYLVGEGAGSSNLYYSADGITWTDTGFNLRAASRRFAIGDDFVIAMGGDDLVPEDGIIYSADGITWTEIDPAAVGAGTILDVFFLNGYYYVVDINGAMYFTDNPSTTPFTSASNEILENDYIKLSSTQGASYIISATDDTLDEKIEVLIQNDDGSLDGMKHKILDIKVTFTSSAGGTINRLDNVFVDAEIVPGFGVNALFLDVETGYYKTYITPIPGGATDITAFEWVSGDKYVIGTNVGTFISDLKSGTFTDITGGITDVLSIQVTDTEIIVGGNSGGTTSFDRYSIVDDATNFVLPLNFNPIKHGKLKKYIKA